MARDKRSPRIKICGITTLEDGDMAAHLGADALGFVFAPSLRKIDPQKCNHIVRNLPPAVTTVGVFMDQPFSEVMKTVEITGVDVVQLHGKEAPDFCRRLARRVIKRIHVYPEDTKTSLIQKMGPFSVSAFLIDPGAGVGRPFDWNVCQGIDFPLIIAGGLNPDNVGHLVRKLCPYGVDVSSGVEDAPGKKSYAKIKRFIEEVRCAANSLIQVDIGGRSEGNTFPKP